MEPECGKNPYGRWVAGGWAGGGWVVLSGNIITSWLHLAIFSAWLRIQDGARVWQQRWEHPTKFYNVSEAKGGTPHIPFDPIW